MDAQTVFVVDDDAGSRSALARLFRSAGFHVLAFAGAVDFLADFAPRAEACLILDLRMPGVGGLEVLASVRARDADLPVIVYTGYADVAVTVRAMQQGACDVIEKPLDNELLIERVRQAIARTRKARARRGQVVAARQQLATLSQRELQVAQQLVAGHSAQAIAQRLFISPRTVEAHRVNIFRKLDIKSSTLLARLVVLADDDD